MLSCHKAWKVTQKDLRKWTSVPHLTYKKEKILSDTGQMHQRYSLTLHPRQSLLALVSAFCNDSFLGSRYGFVPPLSQYVIKLFSLRSTVVFCYRGTIKPMVPGQSIMTANINNTHSKHFMRDFGTARVMNELKHWNHVDFRQKGTYKIGLCRIFDLFSSRNIVLLFIPRIIRFEQSHWRSCLA